MAETLKEMIQALGYTVTTRQKHKARIEIPPQCSVPNCTNQAVQVLAKSHPNYPSYRRASWIKREHPNAVDIWCCARHHNQNTAKKHNVKSAKHLTANRLGMSYTEYSNQFHPYLR